MTLLLLASTAAAFDAEIVCTSPSHAADLVAGIAAAESAYVSMDLDGFRAAADRARAALPCLDETLLPIDAAAYYRLVALDAYVGQDMAGARRAFQAAIAIQPGFVLPSTMAPAGNPLEALYQMARNQPSRPGTVLVPPDGHLATVDGARATVRPVDRPAILQLSAASGEVRWTRWIPPGAASPEWSAFAEPAPMGIDLPAPASPRRRPTLPLAIGAGGAAALAVGLYGGAVASRAEYDGAPFEELDGLRGRTNGLVYGAAGVGVAAVGLLTATLLTAEW